MCGITAVFNKVCGANSGGISTIAIAQLSDIATIPSATANIHTVATDITMVATKKFWGIDFTEETAEANDPLEGDVDAQFVKPTIMFTVAGQVPATVANVQNMLGGRYVAIVTYLDGTRRVFGSKATPLRLMKAGGKSGKYGANDRKGYEFELSCASNVFPFFYTGAYTTIVDTVFT